MADDEKLLQTCIHDYLLQNGMPELAQMFQLQADLRIDDLVKLPGPNFLLDHWRTYYVKYVAPKFEKQAALTQEPYILNQQLPILSRGSSASTSCFLSQQVSPFSQQDLARDQNIGIDFDLLEADFLDFNTNETFSNYGDKLGISSIPLSGSPSDQSFLDGLLNDPNFDTYETFNPTQQKAGLSISCDRLSSSSTSLDKSPSTGKRKFAKNAQILNAASERPDLVKKAFSINPPRLQINKNLRNVTPTTGGTGKTNADFYNTATNDLGSSLVEFSTTRTPILQLSCHDFSPDGEILGCIGHDETVVLWNIKSKTLSALMTRLYNDVRFAPNSSYLTACSSENAVQIWNPCDANDSSPTLFTDNPVNSMDFNPKNNNQLCTADIHGIRLWSINQRTNEILYKEAIRQVRFKPQDGNIFAASTNISISLFNAETKLRTSFIYCGHEKEIHTICWDASGKYIATVSEDKARIWSVPITAKPIYEIRSNGGKKFESCTFHPQLTAAFVIGSYQTLEVWNPSVRNDTVSVSAHSGIVSALCASSQAGIIASTSDDKCLKFWK